MSMRLCVFSVRDAKVEAFMSPFFARSSGEARRMFENVVNDPQTSFCKNPEDYGLYQIGTYEDTTALLEACQVVLVVQALEVKVRPVVQVPLPPPVGDGPDTGDGVRVLKGK